MREIYREAGLRGFYKGLSASYAGVSETVVQFVVYEKIKKYVEEEYRIRGTHSSQLTSGGGVLRALRDCMRLMV